LAFEEYQLCQLVSSIWENGLILSFSQFFDISPAVSKILLASKVVRSLTMTFTFYNGLI
jgi:hypothetical protein